MWWHDRQSWRRGATVVVLLAAAGLTAGCFEPVYGTRPALNSESVQDRFAGIEVKPIIAPQGHADRARRGRHVQRTAIQSAQWRLADGADLPAGCPGRFLAIHRGYRRHHRPAGHTDRGRQRQLPADRDFDRQGGRKPTASSRMSTTTFPAPSSASPDSGRGAMPRTTRLRLSPRLSETGWRLISSPGPDGDPARPFAPGAGGPVSDRLCSIERFRSSPRQWSPSKVRRSTGLSRVPIRRGRSCWSSVRTPALSANASRRSSRHPSMIPTIRFRWCGLTARM